MTVFFRRMEIMLTAKMDDNAVLQIVGMEKDIVDKIVENPVIIESGLRITQREKQTSCGIIYITHKMEDTKVENLYGGWKKAVQRTLFK